MKSGMIQRRAAWSPHTYENVWGARVHTAKTVGGGKTVPTDRSTNCGRFTQSSTQRLKWVNDSAVPRGGQPWHFTPGYHPKERIKGRSYLRIWTLMYKKNSTLTKEANYRLSWTLKAIEHFHYFFPNNQWVLMKDTRSVVDKNKLFSLPTKVVTWIKIVTSLPIAKISQRRWAWRRKRESRAQGRTAYWAARGKAHASVPIGLYYVTFLNLLSSSAKWEGHLLCPTELVWKNGSRNFSF